MEDMLSPRNSPRARSPDLEKEEDEELLLESHKRNTTRRQNSFTCKRLPFTLTLLAGLLVLLFYFAPSNASRRLTNYLNQRHRPLFFRPVMFFNESTDCDLKLELTDDFYATDVFIGDIYQEDRGVYDHANRSAHWQTFALFTIEENPLPIFLETKRNRTLGLPSYYDLLVSYELDSDLPYTYRMVSKFKDLRAPPVPFHDKLQQPIAAVLISNCQGHNTRNAITAELSKLLPGRIYSYGKCEHNREMSQDLPDGFDMETAREAGTWEEAKQALTRRFKFVLAFENANTVDYVTEKYWDALAGGVVPVYLGAPNLREHFMPHPKAAIIASEYDTVEDLAEHLHYLADNETAYNEYLEWKTLPFSENFQKIVDYSDGPAPLCRLAHLARGEWSNPLKSMRTSELYGQVRLPDPRTSV